MRFSAAAGTLQRQFRHAVPRSAPSAVFASVVAGNVAGRVCDPAVLTAVHCHGRYGADRYAVRCGPIRRFAHDPCAGAEVAGASIAKRERPGQMQGLPSGSASRCRAGTRARSRRRTKWRCRRGRRAPCGRPGGCMTLDLPAAALAEVLKLRNDNRPADADRLQQALTTLRSQLDQNPDALFRFFIRFDEMQKHVSLWEIHLQQNGKCRLQDGQQSLEVEFSSETELADKLFEASKSLEDPHSLVLLLVTWGDAQLGAQQKTRRAVTSLRDLLKRDSENRQIYDYVVLGFRPTGPVIHPQQPPTTPPR